MFTTIMRRGLLVSVLALFATVSTLTFAPSRALAAKTVFNSSGIVISCTFHSASPGYQSVSLTAYNRDSKSITNLRITSTYNTINFGAISPWGNTTKSVTVANRSYGVYVQYTGLSYYIKIGALAFGAKDSNC